jgi:hypothetical protein
MRAADRRLSRVLKSCNLAALAQDWAFAEND